MASLPPDLSVVRLHSEAMAADIVGSLRRAADNIAAEGEADDRTVAVVAVSVSESGEVALYGWGRCSDRFTVIGMLHAAIVQQG
ncbi:hypothetical protein HZY97_16215 [Sphingomonas sp. R-74633]|uniref:hypothetical protein n=1 Tax=Sphingomonas sp. R-74633 TaxID=2751188 RepID=UPI0015D3284F|nr:hypothetical protein [Sphingomonas sp. R-74633]NYT42318.1 hypothetical protein [Sphingomonas sp. R-74633]